MSSSNKSSSSNSLLSTQTLVAAGIGWALLALLFFLLFSAAAPGEERPTWYLISTYVLELVAFLSAGLLCMRNWRSSQIVSGRTVWLCLGLGCLFYFLGSLGFGVWELVFNVDPLVSLGDLFYLASYVSLVWGIVLAVTSRRLNLSLWQWVGLAASAAISITLAALLKTAPDEAATNVMVPPANAAVVQVESISNTEHSELLLAQSPAASPASPTPSVAPDPAASPAEEPTNAPGWVLAIDNLLAPLEGPVNLFYVLADIVLLIAATALLLAFWGGRLVQSWRMIAAAAVCLYIGDMYTLYAWNFIADYQSGALLEVVYVFSGVLFAIGAALEFSTSASRSRRGRRRSGGGA